MEPTSLVIDGMSCNHRVRAVAGAQNRLDGVAAERVEVGAARVSYDRAQTSLARTAKAIEAEGYSVRSTGGLT